MSPPPASRRNVAWRSPRQHQAHRLETWSLPPRPKTSLVGRERELREVVTLLATPGARLVSITGRSGVGKTRLAIEAANDLVDLLPVTVVFVDFSTLDDAALVPWALATALDVRAGRGVEAPHEQIQAWLAAQPSLVVVDDIDAVAGGREALLDLLPAAREVRALVTARAPLRVDGEHVIRLAPLPVSPGRPGTPDDDPDRDDHRLLPDLESTPAIALFTARAASVDPGFTLTGDTIGAVAELCRRLDGLPLAIELAAARARVLPVAAQIEVLDRGSTLDLHVSNRSGALPRHRSLRASIAWSASLLSAAERRLLRRMAVFESGCTLAALRGVCADPRESEADVLDALMALVDGNLVEPSPTGQAVRYRLLPTIREYAREELIAKGEESRLLARHSEWFIAFAKHTRPLDRVAQAGALDPERHELHAVLGRLVEGDDVSDALSLAADLGPLWLRRGFFGGVEAWLESLLRRAGEQGLENEAHARALTWAVVFASFRRLDPELRSLAIERLARARALADKHGSPAVRLACLHAEATAVFITYDLERAVQAAGTGYELAIATDETQWQTRFETLLAMAAQRAKDPVRAATLGAAAYRRAVRDRDGSSIAWTAMLLHALPADTPGLPDALPPPTSLLLIAREAGDLDAELSLIARIAVRSVLAGDVAEGGRGAAEGLELALRTGSPDIAAFCVLALTMAAAARGDLEHVARLHGSIAPMIDRIRVGLAESDAVAYLGLVDAARGRLGVERFEGLVADVGLLDWDERILAAAAYGRELGAAASRATMGVASTRRAARRGGARTAEGHRRLIESLTPREVEVLSQLATGASNREIGGTLGLRPKTVMHHSVSIYGKLGVRGRAEATAWAFRNGLIVTHDGAEGAVSLPSSASAT